jgi:hypothetical protein
MSRADAGIETPVGCDTFRANGITDYLTNGGRIEVRAARGRAYKRENDLALVTSPIILVSCACSVVHRAAWKARPSRPKPVNGARGL